jgi:hypothetical protein
MAAADAPYGDSDGTRVPSAALPFASVFLKQLSSTFLCMRALEASPAPSSFSPAALCYACARRTGEVHTMRIYLRLILLFLALLLAGCKDNSDERMFQRLLSSDFGLGISLGDSRAAVTAKLGQPFQRTSKVGGKIVEESYLPGEVKEYAANVPQLTLDYNDNHLTRLSNLYRPFEKDPAQPDPPHKILVLPGLGLGNRKSDFMSKLGKPNSGALNDQWRFVGKDGRSISVQALFTTRPESTEQICTTLNVTLAPKVAEQRGEQYEGKK